MTLKMFLITSALTFILFFVVFFLFYNFFVLFGQIRDVNYTVEPLLTTMARYCLVIVLTQTKPHEAELRFKNLSSADNSVAASNENIFWNPKPFFL